jgi:hypothetical protein
MENASMSEKDYKEMILKQAELVKTEADLCLLLTQIKEFKHDYGTIIMGILGAMKGAFNVINRSENGGITGFQASCLAHELIQEYMMIKPPYRIVQYDHLLYPQYENRFEKKISMKTHQDLIKKAKDNLKEKEMVHPDVKEHWVKISEGWLPFDFTIGEMD